MPIGHKKGQSGKGWRTSRRLFQMEVDANIGIVFNIAIKKRNFLGFRLQSYFIESMYLSYNSKVTSSPHLSHLLLQNSNTSLSDKKSKLNIIDL